METFILTMILIHGVGVSIILCQLGYAFNSADTEETKNRVIGLFVKLIVYTGITIWGTVLLWK